MGKIEDQLIQNFQNMDEFTMETESQLTPTNTPVHPPEPISFEGLPKSSYSSYSSDTGMYYNRETGRTWDGGRINLGQGTTLESFKELQSQPHRTTLDIQNMTHDEWMAEDQWRTKDSYASPTDLKVGEWVTQFILSSFGAAIGVGAAKAFRKLPKATKLAYDVYRRQRTLDDIFATELKNYKLPPYKPKPTGLPKGKGREGLPTPPPPASAISSAENPVDIGWWMLRFMRPSSWSDKKIPLGMNKAQWTKYVSNPYTNPGVSWKVWENPRLFEAYKIWEKYLKKDLPGPISSVLEEGKKDNLFG